VDVERVLVPLALVLLIGAWGVGYFQQWQQRPRRDR
jgi:hypothetical protein